MHVCVSYHADSEHRKIKLPTIRLAGFKINYPNKIGRCVAMAVLILRGWEWNIAIKILCRLKIIHTFFFLF